ncbi:hypothetical protein NW856_13955, partial [Synechococcus sp. R3-13]
SAVFSVNVSEPAAAFRDSLLMYCFIWAVLAIGCFQVLPRIQVVSAAELQPWLAPSYFAGLGGSLLAALGSLLAISAETTPNPADKKHLHRLAWGLGTVGFLGVLSPLGLAGAFFLKAAQGTDWWQGLFG